jgi:8-oxo-dGTP pyrophosphatase MutT (NUDIX family)
MAGALTKAQRVAAYGIARDPAGGVALVRASDRSDVPGTWFLPGGGVEHGEHPEATVVREFEEETGLVVEVEQLLRVLSDVAAVERSHESLHQVRLVYSVRLLGGALRHEVDGSSDLVRWVHASEWEHMRLARFVALILGIDSPHAG